MVGPLLFTDWSDLELDTLVRRFRQADIRILSELATAFALACSLERLKRAGALDDYQLEDPFRPDGNDSLVLPKEDAAFYASNASPEQLRRFVQARLHPTTPRPSVN